MRVIKKLVLIALVVLGVMMVFSEEVRAGCCASECGVDDAAWCCEWDTCGGEGGGGKYWSCFLAGTEVEMAPTVTSTKSFAFKAGKQVKNIEDVKVGDRVVSENEEGERVISRVTKLDQPVRQEMCEIEFESGNKLKVTDEHPLFTPDGWKSIDSEKTADDNPDLLVSKMEVGDKVRTADGEWDEVVSIACWSEENQTYNLILDGGVNTYFADGYLAHNKDKRGKCAKDEKLTLIHPITYTQPPSRGDCNLISWGGRYGTDNWVGRWPSMLHTDADINWDGPFCARAYCCAPTTWDECDRECGGGTQTSNCGTIRSCNTQSCCIQTAPSNFRSADVTERSALLEWTPGENGTKQVLYVDSDAGKIAEGCVNNLDGEDYLDWRWLNNTGTAKEKPVSPVTSGEVSFSNLDENKMYKVRYKRVNGTTLEISEPFGWGEFLGQAEFLLEDLVVNENTVTIGFNNDAAETGDWMGLYDYNDLTKGYLDWKWLNNTGTVKEKPVSPVTSGEVSFSNLDEDILYNIRYIVNGKTLEMSEPFGVGEFSGSAEVLLENPVINGNTVTVGFSNESANKDDWIGLFEQYVSCAVEEENLGGSDNSYMTGEVLMPQTTYTYSLTNHRDVVSDEICDSSIVGQFDRSDVLAVPWFQVQGGSVHSQGGIYNNIPYSCAGDLSCKDFLILSDANGEAGAVSFTGSIELGAAGADKVSENDQDWYMESKYRGDKTSYLYFERLLQDSPEPMEEWDGAEPLVSGIYKAEGSMSTVGSPWSIPSDVVAVLLADGDVNIDSEIEVAEGGFLAIISSGNININGQATHLEGVFIADGYINTGTGMDQLVGEGVFVGWDGVNLERGLNLDPLNNVNPSEFFIYRADLQANAHRYLLKPHYTWVEVAP